MKKIFFMLLALLCLTALFSCGDDKANGDGTATGSSETGSVETFPEIDESKSLYYTTAAGEKIYLGYRISTVKSKIGEPLKQVEAKSCNRDGMDRIYYYDGFALYTYPQDAEDIVYIIELDGTGITTPEGAAVNISTVDEVKSIYGEDFTKEGQTLVYKKENNMQISFAFDEGKLKFVEYLMK